MNSLVVASSLAAIITMGWIPTGWGESASFDIERKEAVAQPRLKQAAMILDQVNLAAKSAKVKTVSIRALVAAPMLVEFSSVKGGLNPAHCSIGTANACSTTQGGGEKDCSVKEDGQQSSSAACSILTGDPVSTQGSCSVEPETNDFCSVRATGITELSDCSVKSTGNENFCSIDDNAEITTGNNETICSVEGSSADDRAGAECSVFERSGSERWCSVYKGENDDYHCTVFQGNTVQNETKCSTHGSGTTVLCSVVDTATSTVAAPDANGLCDGK